MELSATTGIAEGEQSLAPKDSCSVPQPRSLSGTPRATSRHAVRVRFTIKSTSPNPFKLEGAAYIGSRSRVDRARCGGAAWRASTRGGRELAVADRRDARCGLAHFIGLRLVSRGLPQRPLQNVPLATSARVANSRYGSRNLACRTIVPALAFFWTPRGYRGICQPVELATMLRSAARIRRFASPNARCRGCCTASSAI